MINGLQNKILFIFLGLYLLGDIAYTFLQHTHKSFDGDLIPIVLPVEGYQEVLTDPFGIDVLLKNESYAGTNRFFVHWYLSNFFKTIPLSLQTICSPIASIYFASGLSKTICHVLIIIVLSMLIIGANRIFNQDFIIAAAILTPLFQSGGHFYKYIGIVDQSITYSSFYAWPMLLFLLFLKPYIFQLKQDNVLISPLTYAGIISLLIILPFSGPLIPGVVIVVTILCGIFCGEQYFKTGKIGPFKRLPMPMILMFGFLVLLSVYSLYLGQFNAEGQSGRFVSIADRYQRLPVGVFNLLTQKLAFPLLVAMLILNIWLLRKNNIRRTEMVLLLKYLTLFTIIYLLLLPLGGMREYRPNILRKDTFLPVILCMVFFYGYSTFYILKNRRIPFWRGYLAGVVLFSLIFTYADEPDFYHDDCEREQLQQLSRSAENQVQLSEDCTVFSWYPVRDSSQTRAHSILFDYWNITEEPKLFYQKVESGK